MLISMDFPTSILCLARHLYPKTRREWNLGHLKRLVLFYNPKKPKDARVDFDLPPSPPSIPIIGHLHLLLSVLIHRSLQKLSSKYGSILYLHIFGFPVVLVSSASIAYEIFRAHDVNISSRGFPPTDDSLFAGSFSFISAPYGDYWRFMKKLLVTNLLGPQALERSLKNSIE